MNKCHTVQGTYQRIRHTSDLYFYVIPDLRQNVSVDSLSIQNTGRAYLTDKVRDTDKVRISTGVMETPIHHFNLSVRYKAKASHSKAKVAWSS